jgi:DNA topoisomerase IB
MAGAAAAPTAPERRVRLRRSNCSGPGLQRVRRGRGFSYVDAAGQAVRDPDVILRLKELVIPPAWQDVWICADPRGHLQATGVDAAGRKQYLYHPRWREQQDQKKFDRMLDFAQLLPRLRRRLKRVLLDSQEIDRERVLACAVRLLDVGLFRIGSEQYADGEGGVGLATVTKADVTIHDDEIVFDYVGKSDQHQQQAVQDQQVRAVVRALKRRRGGGVELLAYRERGRWRDVRSEQINDYLKAQVGEQFSAKDFRTWNATVLAAVSLAVDGREAATKSARKRAIDGAVRGVAEVLGNTPAVARRSYIDPRVFDRYQSGWTIGGAVDHVGRLRGPDDRRRTRLEAAVLDLLHDDRGSAAVAKDVASPNGGRQRR